MIKRALSTTGGRIAAVVLALFLVMGIKSAIEQYTPFYILSGLQTGHLKETVPGVLLLPWYLKGASSNGAAYVTRMTSKQIFVVLTQAPSSDGSYSGVLATNQLIPRGMVMPCKSGAECIGVLTPGDAAVLSNPKLNQVAVNYAIRKGLYNINFTADD